MDPPGVNQDDGAWGKYRMVRTDTEESAANSAKWIGEETEELASEEEAKTAGGEEVEMTLPETSEVLEGSSA